MNNFRLKICTHFGHLLKYLIRSARMPNENPSRMDRSRRGIPCAQHEVCHTFFLGYQRNIEEVKQSGGFCC